ncbi:MAG: UvrB/UvrC motif-containing protein [Verrucomicrobiae bacterium]|nr:UvrB/UvrC motif-containing protein [Verrucomicrobiae bacterium]
MLVPMNFDISDLLSKWDYKPGQVVARRFPGNDGREKVQLRVDLGVLQMNAEGRPDGRRPMAHDSWHDFHVDRLRKHVEEHGNDEDFELDADACAKLQQECIQYHHRYICFFQLEDFAAVERDCERNLQVFEFVAEYAGSDELAWSLLQFVPQLLMMRTRARGTALVRRKKFQEACGVIEEGLEELESFYRENGREDLLANSGEVASLRTWMEEIGSRRPLTEFEKLQQALDEAIRTEDYERAALVRDQMRKLQASES